MRSVEKAKALLKEANIFYDCEGDEDQSLAQAINLNDAFFWACSDYEIVADDELPRLAELFFRYGWAGACYWVAIEKRGGEVPEFLDVRRQIEFVKNEEAIIAEEPSSSKRAYQKRQYTIGEAP